MTTKFLPEDPIVCIGQTIRAVAMSFSWFRALGFSTLQVGRNSMASTFQVGGRRTVSTFQVWLKRLAIIEKAAAAAVAAAAAAAAAAAGSLQRKQASKLLQQQLLHAASPKPLTLNPKP